MKLEKEKKRSLTLRETLRRTSSLEDDNTKGRRPNTAGGRPSIKMGGNSMHLSHAGNIAVSDLRAPEYLMSQNLALRKRVHHLEQQGKAKAIQMRRVEKELSRQSTQLLESYSFKARSNVGGNVGTTGLPCVPSPLLMATGHTGNNMASSSTGSEVKVPMKYMQQQQHKMHALKTALRSREQDITLLRASTRAVKVRELQNEKDELQKEVLHLRQIVLKHLDGGVDLTELSL